MASAATFMSTIASFASKANLNNSSSYGPGSKVIRFFPMQNSHLWYAVLRVVVSGTEKATPKDKQVKGEDERVVQCRCKTSTSSHSRRPTPSHPPCCREEGARGRKKRKWANRFLFHQCQRWEIFLSFFKLLGTERYNSYIFLGIKTDETI
jgi:hypothetical protein